MDDRTSPSGAPDPEVINTVAELVLALRALRTWHDLSLQDIERASKTRGELLPRSTAADAQARTDRLPKLRVVQAFVRACDAPEHEVARWTTAWRRANNEGRATSIPIASTSTAIAASVTSMTGLALQAQSGLDVTVPDNGRLWPTADVPEADDRSWNGRLPEGLARRYRRIKRLDVPVSEAELYLVEIVGRTELAVIKHYPRSRAPHPALLSYLSGTHPHTVRYHEFGPGYEVMEYLAGGDLHRRRSARSNGLAVVELYALAQQLSAALAHLHRNRLFHGDVKPSNVALRSDMPLDAVLLDFGFSGPLGLPHATRPRSFAYQPPERVLRSRVSEAADWWGLGMMILELATGRHPFDGLAPEDIAEHFSSWRLIDVSGVADDRLRRLCQGLLFSDEAQRWRADQVGHWLVGQEPISLDATDKVHAEVVKVLGRIGAGAYATDREQALRLAAQASVATDPGMRQTLMRALARLVDGPANTQGSHRQNAASWLASLENPTVVETFRGRAEMASQVSRIVERLRRVVNGDADLSSQDQEDALAALAWVRRAVEQSRLLDAMAEVLRGLDYFITAGSSINGAVLSFARTAWSGAHSAAVWLDEMDRASWAIVELKPGAPYLAERLEELGRSMQPLCDALVQRGFLIDLRPREPLHQSIQQRVPAVTTPDAISLRRRAIDPGDEVTR